MCLVLLFYLAAPGSSFKLDSHRSKILRKLQQFGVHPDTLHYSLFEKPNSVYCIFQVDFEISRFRTGYSQPSSLLYIGSTAIGTARRHLFRMAVYRRLQRTEFVDAELSLRFWSSNNNLFQFVVVPLQAHDSYRNAWISEHELIAQWQAPSQLSPSDQSRQEDGPRFSFLCQAQSISLWNVWIVTVAKAA